MRCAFTFGCGLITGLAVAFAGWMFYSVGVQVDEIERHVTGFTGMANDKIVQLCARQDQVNGNSHHTSQQVAELWKKIGEMEKRNRDLAGVK